MYAVYIISGTDTYAVIEREIVAEGNRDTMRLLRAAAFVSKHETLARFVCWFLNLGGQK